MMSVSIAKTLVKGVTLMSDRYKKILTFIKFKGQWKKNKCQKKNSYIFLHNNDYKIPYIDIYINLLSINFTVRNCSINFTVRNCPINFTVRNCPINFTVRN